MELSKELLAEVDDLNGYVTASGGTGGDCIYAKPLSNGMVAFFDSEADGQPKTIVRGAVWNKFIEGAKSGTFDF
ncbi:DUF397 domain-containing protein [Nonomuraea sp. SYSU D8015]|uniref:DUF397 domain-containing protein n=1 Tax=Nonomuraea sp. SYSU D8015 TaxID=2593644 RepID=UPI001CB6EEAC|nr:DUF397 domain-containing protein [Nonomuraea sp. SYSU D8015]